MLLSDILDACLIAFAHRGIDLRVCREQGKCRIMRGNVCVVESENIAHVVERLHAYHIILCQENEINHQSFVANL